MNYIDNKPLYEFNNALLSNANALDFDKFKKALFDWEKFILINQILTNLNQYYPMIKKQQVGMEKK